MKFKSKIQSAIWKYQSSIHIFYAIFRSTDCRLKFYKRRLNNFMFYIGIFITYSNPLISKVSLRITTENESGQCPPLYPRPCMILYNKFSDCKSMVAGMPILLS